MSRISKSIKNVTYAFVGQIFALIISFFSRIIFIKILGAEYLGINGLFTNILTMLSLAELGIGEAITFSLYKPLKEKNIKNCTMLMQLYKKVYYIIGIVIFLIGILFTPFLEYFIGEMPDISNIYFIFILFVINSSVSYFFSYKRNLIIADQNRYIATLYRYSIYFIMNVFQIIYLLLFNDYIGFLLIQIISTIVENLLISKKANKMYPYLKNKEKIRLNEEYKKTIKNNTKAMMMHKVGSAIVISTDNILLSKLVNLVAVGIYSNYYLVINALHTIFSQIFTSLTASVGNLCVSEKKEKQESIFKKTNFLNFWIYSIATTSLICLFNHLIILWVGEKYLFDFYTVCLLGINFYITGMRKSVSVFREASGLFYIDRWKAIVEAIVNLVFSVIFALKFGAFGVFLGTFISSITVCVWVEPFVLYKYGFNKNFKYYVFKYLEYIIVTLINTILTFFVLKIFNDYSIFTFNTIIIILYRNSNEYKYYKNILLKQTFNKKHTKN